MRGNGAASIEAYIRGLTRTDGAAGACAFRAEKDVFFAARVVAASVASRTAGGLRAFGNRGVAGEIRTADWLIGRTGFQSRALLA